MNKPHKHAEVIKAWADGAEIEYLETMTSKEPYWANAPMPKWSEETMYRVKQTPKPDTQYWLRTYEHSGGSIFTPHLLSPTEVQPANIKLTFDGETGKLKSAEVL
jgi:hypothetical protein